MAESMDKTKQRKKRRTEVGVVTSAHKTPKTISVEVKYQVRHPLYGKIIRRSTVLHAHDAKREAELGDKVQVMQCRPISKTKSWRLVKVLTPGPRD